MEREVTVSVRQFVKDVAVTWAAALGIGVAVGGAAALLIVFINSVTI